MKPSVPIDVFVFALFNKDLKPMPASERNYGLFYPNGDPVYNIGLNGYLPQFNSSSAYKTREEHLDSCSTVGSCWGLFVLQHFLEKASSLKELLVLNQVLENHVISKGIGKSIIEDHLVQDMLQKMEVQLKPLTDQLARAKDLTAPDFGSLQAWEAQANAAARAENGNSSTNDPSRSSQGQGFGGTPMSYLGDTKVTFLDKRYRLAESKDYEVKVAYLRLAITSGCKEYYSDVEKTLKEVGRMRYLRRLYSALVQSPGNDEAKVLAKRVFTRDCYHPIAQGVVESILSKHLI